MTAEDKVEIKSYIHDAMIGYTSRVDAQNEITNMRLAAISEHLMKLNGRTSKSEEAINMALQERAANRQKQQDYFIQIDDLDKRLDEVEKKEASHVQLCPNMKAIRDLQDEALGNKSVKRFMFVMFTGGIAIGSLTVALIRLIIGG